jgi:pyrimidine deaminase RibD-like protein
MDHLLEQTIQFLKDHWLDHGVGIVAACIADGEKIVFATSIQKGDFWYHAERNAYDSFKLKFGEPGKNASFISTLSPCIGDLKHRKEESCANLISNLGIKKIHFGVLDTHHTISVDAYKQFGFQPSLTKDDNLHAICTRLMNLFTQYDSRINQDLIGIKKEIGSAIFKGI